MADDPRDDALGMIAAALHSEVCNLSPGDEPDCNAIAEVLLALFPVARWQDHSVDASQLGDAHRTVMVQRAAVLTGPVRYVRTDEIPYGTPRHCTCPATWSKPLPSANDLGHARPDASPACPHHGGTE